MQEVTKFVGGIHTDNKAIFQPKGTLLYALNSTISSKEGDLGTRTNELGNVSCLELEPGFKIVGHKNIEDKVILFITNDVISIIGEKDVYCNFTELIRSSCLGFKTCNQIQCEFEIVQGCERVIYFVDGKIKDKAINLDRLSDYTVGNVDNVTANTNDAWDCDLLSISASTIIPCIELNVLPTGGNLPLGAIQVVVGYADSTQNVSDWLAHTAPISVNNTGTSYNDTEGGLQSITGNTNSSLNIKISGLDTRYPYLNIAIVQIVEGVTTAYKITQRNINGSSLDFTFSGVNPSIDTEITLSELGVSTVPFDTSKTIKIHDNRLLRGNLLERQIDWTQFQLSANNIQAYYKTSANLHGSLNEFDGYKNPKANFKKKSYLRDEIYAFGIVWVFKDGTVSPAMHIPGRELNKFPDKTVINYNIDPNKFGTTLLNVEHTRQPTFGLSGVWDTRLGPTANFAEDLTINPTGVRHEIYNTAIRTNAVVNSFGPSTNSGILSFHENDVDYPTTKDCDGNYIYPVDPITGIGKVRHHKMPDTTLEPHYYVDGNGNEFIIELGMEFKNIVPPIQYANQIQGYYIVRSERSENNKTVIDKGIIYNNMVLYYDFSGSGSSSIKTVEYTDPLLPGTKVGTNVTTFPTSDNKYLMQPLGPNSHFEGCRYGSFNSNLPAKVVFASNNGSSGYIHTSHTNFSFYGVNAKFTPESVNGEFIKIEGLMQGDVSSWDRYKEGINGSFENRMRTHEEVFYSSKNISNAYQMTNRLLKDQQSMAAHNLSRINNTIFINNAQQETYGLELDNYLLHANYNEADRETVLNMAAGDQRDDKDVPLGNPGLDYTTESKAFYVSLKKRNSTIYGAIDGISYIKASHCMHPIIDQTAEIFGGDSFITKFSYKKSGVTMNRVTDKRDGIWAQVLTMFVESEVNTELRHSIETPISAVSGETSLTTYYPKQEMSIFLREGDYNQLSTGIKDDTTTGEVINGFHDGKFAKNFYRYNTDYSKENNLKYYFPLSKAFDFCSECLNYFPHKIIYSNKSFVDDAAQSKRIFLANNTTDISSGFGELTNLFTDNDQLWVHSERSIFKQQTKPNEMNIGSSTVFIGVGEIFSIPPNQIKTIDTGYAGSKHKFATHTNEIGTYFVSAEAGKIFLIQGESLKDITLTGNSMWFYNNLPIQFEKQYKKLTGNKYPCIEGIANKRSVGFMSVYDNENKRWILTKKDYKILEDKLFINEMNSLQNVYEDVENGNVEFDSVIYNPILDIFFVVTGNTNVYVVEIIEFGDFRYFQNLSWTISFVGDQLVSWHSYLPDYMFNTQNELFTAKNNELWKHNIGNYQTYYGLEHDHILEWVDNESPGEIKVIGGIEYRQSCEKFNSVNETWVKDLNSTFTKLIAYNDISTTGTLNILSKTTPYDSIAYNPTQALAFHKENIWRINQLRDYSISPLVSNFTKQWAQLAASYPIDKVVNSANINVNKSQYELNRLRGKYLVIRGTFNNPDKTLKLSTEFINTEYDNSLR
jgi:hypothetical protein